MIANYQFVGVRIEGKLKPFGWQMLRIYWKREFERESSKDCVLCVRCLSSSFCVFEGEEISCVRDYV